MKMIEICTLDTIQVEIDNSALTDGKNFYDRSVKSIEVSYDNLRKL